MAEYLDKNGVAVMGEQLKAAFEAVETNTTNKMWNILSGVSFVNDYNTGNIQLNQTITNSLGYTQGSSQNGKYNGGFIIFGDESTNICQLNGNSSGTKLAYRSSSDGSSFSDWKDLAFTSDIPTSLPSNGIINAYTINGIISPAISVSSTIRFDTKVCEQYLNNTTNKFTGCNNAILSISRFDDDQYTTQLGFSGNGIYARIFSGETPDTSTSWKTMIMDDGSGNVTANAYYISSDERLKTFGDDIKVDFDELAKLRKSHFVFNDNPTKQEIGVSAQEVQKLYPEIVNETEEGTLSVDYSKLAVVALAAIDKLNQRIQELENKLIKYEQY